MSTVYELTITSIAPGGDGVSKLPDGRTAFLPYGAPGDVVRARIIQDQKNFVRARIDQIVTPGPGRVTPPCPVAGRCGGCAWQHLDYQSQADAKTSFLVENLKRIGKLEEPPVRPIWAAESPFAYRNKAQVPVGKAPDGSMRLGYYKEGSHDIVALPDEGCRILAPAVDRALAFVRVALPGLKQRPYDPKAQEGNLRHVMIRATERGEAMVVIVTREPLGEPARKNAMTWMGQAGIVSVQNNLQRKTGNVILGEETLQIAGTDALTEELDGLKFRLTATSFFQVNNAQTRNLWKALAAARTWTSGDRVLELYCGVGTLSLALARLGADVVGFEANEGAVQDARANAALNGLAAVFETGDAARAWERLPAGWKPQLMVVDPPRKGLDAEVIDGLAAVGVSELLYVSCDPASLARDTARLAEKGYRMRSCQPVDLFPQTAHIESVALFHKIA